MKTNFSKVISYKTLDLLLHYVLVGFPPVLNACLFIPLGLLLLDKPLLHHIGESFSFFKALGMASTSLLLMCIAHIFKEVLLQLFYQIFGEKISHSFYAKISTGLLITLIGIIFYSSYRLISPMAFEEYGYYYLLFIYAGPIFGIQLCMDETKEMQEFILSQTK